jgi:hypothetical protein
MVAFVPKEEEPKAQALRKWQLRRCLTELWSYALIMAVVLGGASVLLSGDILLAVPVIGVCLVVGCVGTLLASSRYKKDNFDDYPYSGVFRR